MGVIVIYFTIFQTKKHPASHPEATFGVLDGWAGLGVGGALLVLLSIDFDEDLPGLGFDVYRDDERVVLA